METQQYGPSSDGYTTPYQTSIVYNTESFFETTVAFLSDRAQLVNTIPALLAVEHISPEVLLFGDKPSAAVIASIHDRGFQIIHHFVADAAPVASDAENPEKFVTFGLNTIHDHLALKQGFTAVYLLEYVMLAIFPQYAGVINDDAIDANAGRCLIKAICDIQAAPGVTIARLGSSPRCVDEILTLVTKGRTMREIAERKSAARLTGGVTFNAHGVLIYAAPIGDFVDELVVLSARHPNVIASGAHIVILYGIENKPDKIGWRVIVQRVERTPAEDDDPADHSNITPADILAKFTADYDADIGTAWVAMGSTGDILPFIW